ncbi:hypothetical protein SAMN02745220_03287 [Desulfopila aestuarii DSM 18488]|uniref:Uncharacterized protein n=1 Tax=Desulfopila aestuarii DSM 18488 TaxID=1121416 RepID=A0A1M7YBZ5_9BACT|nr:hypothetical protein SAMN02745220_03287 [Desulfopila aestuarii DSM 18488]
MRHRKRAVHRTTLFQILPEEMVDECVFSDTEKFCACYVIKGFLDISSQMYTTTSSNTTISYHLCRYGKGSPLCCFKLFFLLSHSLRLRSLAESDFHYLIHVFDREKLHLISDILGYFS